MTKRSALAERPASTDVTTASRRKGRPPHRADSSTESGRPRRSRLWMILVAGLVVAVLGAGELARMVNAGEPANTSSEAEMSGLKAAITKVEWINFDHEMDNGGFAMPGQMMPDMPADGFGRLSVDVTFENVDSESARALAPEEEFRLLGYGEPIDLKSDTFGGLSRLNTEEAVKGSLFFDLPVEADGNELYLEWDRGGDTERMLLDPGGEPPDHGH